MAIYEQSLRVKRREFEELLSRSVFAFGLKSGNGVKVVLDPSVYVRRSALSTSGALCVHNQMSYAPFSFAIELYSMTEIVS